MKSLAEIDAMVVKLYDLEVREKARRDEANGLKAEGDALRGEILQELERQGVPSFKGSVGSVHTQTRFSVKFPQDLERKAELKEYLIGKNAFDGMWSVNYQTLNSFYKQEVEVLQNAGEYPTVPGLEPTSEKILVFRKNASKG